MSEANKFFVEDEKDLVKEAPKVRTRKQAVPPEYLKVNLSSLGKLNMPAVVHVRDYTGEDAFKLGIADDHRFFEVLVSIVNNMIYEEIDANDLHENELVEIMLNIFVNFWSTHIQNYPFPVTDEDWKHISETMKKEIDAGTEHLLIDINIAKVKTDLIDEKFNEPIHFKKDKLDVSFILPRVGHIFITQEYILNQFYRESEEFHRIENLIQFNAKLHENDIESIKYIDPIEQAKFDKYLDSKLALTAKVQSAQTIHSYKGKVLETLEEKLDVYDKLDSAVWANLNKVIEKYSGFGVDSNVEVESPITKEMVTRRFRFQLLDFIPNAELRGDAEYAVTFGEL